MKLPTINGRECVPVRLLPFMTYWRPLSPDRVARLFSRQDEVHHWSISSFNLRPDGTHHKLEPRAWNNIDEFITELDFNLRKQEDFESQGKYEEWCRRSVRLLPAAVFVWRDDLEADYARTFGRVKYISVRPGAVEPSEEEVAAELDSLIRLCRDPDTADEADAAVKRSMEEAERNTVCQPGDGELNFTPLLSQEDEKVVFEGFESALASGQLGGSAALERPMQSQTAQEEAILAKLVEMDYSPEALPKAAPGRAGVKAAIRRAIGTGPLFQSPAVFGKAWQRLRDSGRIAEA